MEKSQELNVAVAQILNSEVSPLDTDGIAHYFVDPKNTRYAKVIPHEKWQESTFHQRLVIDVFPKDQSIAVSYFCKENDVSFRITHCKIDAVLVYEDKEEDEPEYEIIFETPDLGGNSVMVELQPSLNAAVGIFYNKDVFPELITKKWPI
ncbi:hypothetical protein [Candidatus Uabimicrobium amorphum]|uniref:Uncharacterized protein n=1 Tax=Uabimicrobium amorphum TaxID=2596890 RepID=A0A5S9IRR4_UABAM|nr:hypothetical protein [Candidatus Uabimicrobium amorphum]BBM86923.1 hypothetical protein UABAM_05325 [Candidatus Uabimicrobium amorphum]